MHDWRLILIALAIIYPVIYSGFMPRNAIAFIPLFAFFLGRGFEGAVINMPLSILSVAIMFIIYTIGRGYFIFFTKRIEQVKELADFLDTLPKDGILAEGLISQALAYHTKKRVVVLPRVTDELQAQSHTDMSISGWDLHYVVLSELWRIEKLPYPAVHYVKETPERFVLIKTIDVRYDTSLKSDLMINADRFYVYQIKR